MPELEDIHYSRSDTIATIRSYYHFLTQMYLDESYIIEPPSGGWPSITPHSATLSKSKEVIALLRHLPYIHTTHNDTVDAEAAPECKFADWQDIFERATSRRMVENSTEHRISDDGVPRHVVGLTFGGSFNPRFLLDVKLGTVLWSECPGEIDNEPLCETVDDDPYDYCATEGEAEWRAEGRDWPINEFFEELKGRFRRLEFVPVSGRRVVHVWMRGDAEFEGMVARVREVYREFGWPDLERYDKRACLEAIGRVLKEEFPGLIP